MSRLSAWWQRRLDALTTIACTSDSNATSLGDRQDSSSGRGGSSAPG